MRTGVDYRKSLRDGRRVWVMGEGMIDDVTTHPATRAMVDEYVGWYDLHLDDDWRDVALAPPDHAGKRTPWAYVAPRSADELGGMGRFFSASTFLSAGNITHTPAYGHLIALGLLCSLEERDYSPEQIANAARYREMIAKTGRFLTFCGGGPTIGYRMRENPADRMALKIVRETDAGLVISGKIGMHTSPAYAEDLYVGSVSGLEIDGQRVTFIVPVNAPGITVLCRKIAARDKNPFVAPLSSRFDELEPLAAGDAEGAGGYAKQMDEEFYRKQRELMAQTVAASDVCITTAAIPGKKSPVLVTADAVRGMAPGSVIVDLAAERGGNCELTKPDETVVENGVTILGPTNLPSEVPNHASQMYAKNLTNFVALISRDGKLHLNLEDQVVRETLAAHRGEVVNPRLRELLNLPPLATPQPGSPPVDHLAEDSRQHCLSPISIIAMNNLEAKLFVFLLSTFLGLEVIRRVSPLLHTPLMSLTNAISAIAIVAAIQVISARRHRVSARCSARSP